MNPDRHDAVQADAERYQEVSLRAVELLAKAQRAADEAVAEAQSYARDLEQSAREQYRQILQRAHAAAEGGASPTQGAATDASPAAAAPEGGTLDAQRLMYVRTYARVAHAQLKSVLAALNDELDQLAALAEGNALPTPGPGPVDAPAAPTTVGAGTPSASVGKAAPGIPPNAALAPRPRDHDTWGPGITGTAPTARSTDEPTWPPIFAATNAISYVFRGSAPDGRKA